MISTITTSVTELRKAINDVIWCLPKDGELSISLIRGRLEISAINTTYGGMASIMAAASINNFAVSVNHCTAKRVLEMLKYAEGYVKISYCANSLFLDRINLIYNNNVSRINVSTKKPTRWSDYVNGSERTFAVGVASDLRNAITEIVPHGGAFLLLIGSSKNVITVSNDNKTMIRREVGLEFRHSLACADFRLRARPMKAALKKFQKEMMLIQYTNKLVISVPALEFAFAPLNLGGKNEKV